MENYRKIDKSDFLISNLQYTNKLIKKNKIKKLKAFLTYAYDVELYKEININKYSKKWNIDLLKCEKWINEFRENTFFTE